MRLASSSVIISRGAILSIAVQATLRINTRLSLATSMTWAVASGLGAFDDLESFTSSIDQTPLT